MYVGVGPPPPPARQVGQPQPKPPSRHGDQGGGGAGWANGLPCHPPPAKQFSSRPSPTLGLRGSTIKNRRYVAPSTEGSFQKAKQWALVVLRRAPPSRSLRGGGGVHCFDKRKGPRVWGAVHSISCAVDGQAHARWGGGARPVHSGFRVAKAPFNTSATGGGGRALLEGEGGPSGQSQSGCGSGHRGCESGWGKRFLAVGDAVGVWECLSGRVSAVGRGEGGPPPLQAIPWGGGGTPPTNRPGPTHTPHLKDWAKFCAGPSANQKFLRRLWRLQKLSNTGAGGVDPRNPP